MKPSDELTPFSGSHGRPIEAVEFEAPGVEAPRVEAPGMVGDSLSDTFSEPASKNTFPSRATSISDVKRPWWHSQFNLMLAVFGLLVLAAGLFVFLAPPPELVQTDYSTIEASPLIPDSQTPWTQSQQAEARSKAQSILENLLASKKSLESKQVLDWAPIRYQQALDIASQGDQFYKEAEFALALKSYQQAVDQVNSLFDLLPAIISSRLNEGDTALKEGKSALAKQSFKQVLELEGGNLRATEGLGRAEKLDQVLSFIGEAMQLEAEYLESGELENLLSAQRKLNEAKAIDKLYQPVTDGQKRVAGAITDKRFQLAMSDAYQALFANRYSSARKSFSEALKIKPGDQSAKDALQQSMASGKSASIDSLLDDAAAYEKQEMWASAESNYQTVLQRDPNQVTAKLGKIRSGARSQLDGQILAVLSDTLSFGRSEQKEKAQKVLADAKSINAQGPRLSAQISQLENALLASDSTVKVSLVSNSLTQVSLQKVGSKLIELGQFSSRNMALKPGRYVATGVRLGFHDVRKEIDLYPGKSAIKSITVQCDQAISSSAGQRRNDG